MFVIGVFLLFCSGCVVFENRLEMMIRLIRMNSVFSRLMCLLMSLRMGGLLRNEMYLIVVVVFI